jgi:hypothetical protein
MYAFDAYEWNECICINTAEGFLASGYFRTMRVLWLLSARCTLVFEPKVFWLGYPSVQQPLGLLVLVALSFFKPKVFWLKYP